MAQEININEELMVEEMKALMKGKEIDFIDGDYDGVKVKITIKGVVLTQEDID